MKKINVILMLVGPILVLFGLLIEIIFAPQYNYIVEDEKSATSVENPDKVQISEENKYKLLMIAASASSTLGISLFVGSLTSLLQKSNTAKEEYIKDVQGIYEKEVSPLIEESLSMFITNSETMKMLSPEARESLIKNAISSNNNLDDYKDKVVYEAMKHSEYRRDGYIIANAYIKDNNVYVDETVSYVKGSVYGSIQAEETYVDDDKTSELLYIKYIDPNDSRKYDIIYKSEENDQLKLKSSPAFGGTFEYVNICDIPEKFKEYKEIKVEKKIRFKGSNHWINIGWMHSCPTKGFNLSITCKGDLKIKECIVIDASDTYNVPLNVDDDKFYLSTSQWVSSNTGFVITIGKNDANSSKDDSQ